MDNGNTAIHRGVRKVPSACQRCRRQKLKHRDSEEEPATKRVRTVADNSTETARGPAAEEDAGSQFPRPKCSIPSDEGRTIEEREIPVAQAWNSSSTISLVDRPRTVFQQRMPSLEATRGS
ncbi:hypothetical protein EYZ11_010335 [Aspergillus tanneri]|uniref:Uncharacterized protein n=1 Tax=Aspergillus tanneri TaxID=1220188 RepID=A0A4S3J5X5_9EURO|nr:hypothetical protein EYZ11_010335 [Aspergillus tanneri]